MASQAQPKTPPKVAPVVSDSISLNAGPPGRQICSPKLELFSGIAINRGAATVGMSWETLAGVSDPITVAVGGYVTFVNSPVLNIRLNANGTVTILGWLTIYEDVQDYINALLMAQIGVQASLGAGLLGNVRIQDGTTGTLAAVNSTKLDVDACVYNLDTAVFEYPRTPSKYKSAGASAAGSTALWTPAAGKKFRLMGGVGSLPIGTTTAAILSISLLDAAGVIISWNISPGALAATSQVTKMDFLFNGNGYLSTAANNVLNIQLSNALTAGSCTFTVWGCEE
jgi:hypothetical protein